jgi:hypothetical protein
MPIKGTVGAGDTDTVALMGAEVPPDLGAGGMENANSAVGFGFVFTFVAILFFEVVGT